MQLNEYHLRQARKLFGDLSKESQDLKPGETMQKVRYFASLNSSINQNEVIGVVLTAENVDGKKIIYANANDIQIGEFDDEEQFIERLQAPLKARPLIPIEEMKKGTQEAMQEMQREIQEMPRERKKAMKKAMKQKMKQKMKKEMQEMQRKIKEEMQEMQRKIKEERNKERKKEMKEEMKQKMKQMKKEMKEEMKQMKKEMKQKMNLVGNFLSGTAPKFVVDFGEEAKPVFYEDVFREEGKVESAIPVERKMQKELPNQENIELWDPKDGLPLTKENRSKTTLEASESSSTFKVPQVEDGLNQNV